MIKKKKVLNKEKRGRLRKWVEKDKEWERENHHGRKGGWEEGKRETTNTRDICIIFSLDLSRGQWGAGKVPEKCLERCIGRDLGDWMREGKEGEVVRFMLLT